MTESFVLSPETFALLALLGMRHGLDPDHIAVIDNITFRAMEDRPRVAAWTGTLFSMGHGLSVLVIAGIFGLLGSWFSLPSWFENVMAWVVIGLLLWIGVINSRALLTPAVYAPKGWRHGFLPILMKESTHPAAILAVGAAFGLVVDTAAQIATWGATASASGGLASALSVGAAFAAGMILTDSADSFIVARLMRNTSEKAKIYRRAIGWLIVIISFGMAILGILIQLRTITELSDQQLFFVGAAMTSLVAIALLIAWAGGKNVVPLTDSSPPLG